MEEEQTHRVQMAALSQMQLQAMERVEAQEKELQRLSALLVEHWAVLRSLPERPHQEPPQASPPRTLDQLRPEVIYYLPNMVNTNRGQLQEQVKSLTWVGHQPLRGTPLRIPLQMQRSQLLLRGGSDLSIWPPQHLLRDLQNV